MVFRVLILITNIGDFSLHVGGDFYDDVTAGECEDAVVFAIAAAYSFDFVAVAISIEAGALVQEGVVGGVVFHVRVVFAEDVAPGVVLGEVNVEVG